MDATLKTLVLLSLNYTKDMIPRYYDVTLDIEANRILISTATGGTNRVLYESEESCRKELPEAFSPDNPYPPIGPWNEDLRDHPNFEYDADMGTMEAIFAYSIPEEFREDLKALVSAGNIEELSPEAKTRWTAKMALLKH